MGVRVMQGCPITAWQSLPFQPFENRPPNQCRACLPLVRSDRLQCINGVLRDARADQRIAIPPARRKREDAPMSGISQSDLERMREMLAACAPQEIAGVNASTGR